MSLGLVRFFDLTEPGSAHFNVAAKHAEQVVVVPRLFNEIASTSAHRLHGKVDAAPRCHQNDGQRFTSSMNL